ncbi:MAG: dephospho-CoA kinase [Cytophagaceae bacterium]|nr:dephospho-CoA kinase [Cytophagaceae bacterium]
MNSPPVASRPAPPLIGITGGIGSGKSLVCRIFGVLGVPVYEADYRARWLTMHDADLRKSITVLLGKDAYTATGEYNRAWVANRVFQDAEVLKELNALIHPRVRQDGVVWVQQHTDAPYLLYEAALMRAAGDGNPFANVIVIDAPQELRLQRVLARDPHRSEADVRAIMANQMAGDERLKLANFVVENNEKVPLLDQVLALHEKFSTSA